MENHFNTNGTGKIVEIKLMNGFGFLEYEDPLDARDVVPGTLDPYNPLLKDFTLSNSPKALWLFEIDVLAFTTPLHPLTLLSSST